MVDEAISLTMEMESYLLTANASRVAVVWDEMVDEAISLTLKLESYLQTANVSRVTVVG